MGPTKRGVSECGGEASIMSRSWATGSVEPQNHNLCVNKHCGAGLKDIGVDQE